MTKLIICDLDGTLLNSAKEISDYSVSVLNECQRKGIMIALATARPERSARDRVRGVDADYIISNNGGDITHCGKMIGQTAVPPAVIDELLPLLVSSVKITGITMDTENCIYTDCKDFFDWAQGWNPVFTDFSTIPREHCSKLSAECADAEFIKELIGSYPELRLYPNRGELWYQITHRDVSKMRAARFVCESAGISLSEAAAFGDDYNDVELLRSCGVGVAVENGADEAKQAARFVCSSNDQDGVARWIEDHLL